MRNSIQMTNGKAHRFLKIREIPLNVPKALKGEFCHGFGSFLEKCKRSSHDKILLQMGLEVFHGTSRIYFDIKK